MRRARLAAFLVAALLAHRAAASEGLEVDQGGLAEGRLALEDVLRSVDATFPLLRAAEADRRAVQGELRSARGPFDTRLLADGDLRPAGFYESYSGGAEVEQQTRLWGARLFAGYRIGRGDYAAYDGGLQTNRGGEVRGGLELPLLRGGAIDEPRARLRDAELALDRVEPEIALQRIDFRRDATIAYWNWLAAGLGVDVGINLLDVAEVRQGQIERRVKRGVLPRVDLTDNERLIVDRRIRLRGLERDAEQAAIALSLYLRDTVGDPLIAPPEALPEGFPEEDEPSRDRMANDIALAAEIHPILAALGFRIEAAEVKLRLARNDSLPEVGLRVVGSRDTGDPVRGISSEGSISPNPRGDTEVKALLRFELPVLRREALGRVQSAKAALSRLENERRFAADRIEARIRRAMAGLEAAYVQTVAARRNLALARELEAAEERKLLLGTSNLINVNIRELQTAEGNRALIQAQAEYFRALAEYRAAVGVDS
jgi:outer membrane protein TolC